MSIKIRFHPDNKAIIRWKTPMERDFLKQQLTMFRDSMTNFAKISVKDEKGKETPKIKPVIPSPRTSIKPEEAVVVKLGGEEKKNVIVVEQPVERIP